MGKKKKEKVKVIMHQHKDHLGKFCGALHPLDAEHKKESTQERHDLTVEGS